MSSSTGCLLYSISSQSTPGASDAAIRKAAGIRKGHSKHEQHPEALDMHKQLPIGEGLNAKEVVIKIPPSKIERYSTVTFKRL